MRNINIIAVVLVSVLAFGCSDWLQIEPENDITKDQYWKSKNDVEASVVAAYVRLRKQTPTFFYWGELRADFLADGEDIDTDAQKIMSLRILDDNKYCQWGDMYSVIQLANTVLKYAPAVRDYDYSFTEKDLDGYMAEAYFIRSLSYFYLLRTFKDVPLVLEPSDTDDVNFYLPKSKETEILNQIIADLEKAERGASIDFGSLAKNKGRATKSAIQALLADVYLWSGRFPEAIAMCDKIISRSAHALLPEKSWMEIFTEGNTSEGVFEIQFDAELRQYNSFAGFLGLVETPQFVISGTASEKYRAEDVRGEHATFKPDSKRIWKYSALNPNGDDNVRPLDANWILYRYADILLMKAEALVQMGSYLKAQDLLNKVRERAGLGPQLLPVDRVGAEDMILNERALEFAFEGKRWFDILRMAKRGRPELVVEILLENAPASERPLWESKLSDENSFYLPIHINELRNNTKLVQNPYYEH
ncbi:membrane protein [Fulvitalea axinellae]|uniref:Membrane protein n=2 Tax=Fulvitalea axinellae TaxID=1182444 RepID=A0AAU9CWZ0_9BACT|nr:membrane protein [Fulvitalea axinellae]